MQNAFEGGANRLEPRVVQTRLRVGGRESRREERLPQLGGSLDGMLTEPAVLPEGALVPVPDHLSYAEAATLPCAAVTAWNALTGDGRGVQRGQTVLTTGAGGVSLFAVQFAELLGARVIATTGRVDKEQRLRDLGADEVVNYRDIPDWHTAVRELTGGRGVDRVVDTAGTLEQSLKSLAVDGHVAFVGSVSGDLRPIEPRLLFSVAATVRALAVGSRAQFTRMNGVISAHRLRPVVDRVFPLDEAVAAYRYYESAAPFGKVVITIGQPTGVSDGTVPHDRSPQAEARTVPPAERRRTIQ
ncbi:NAD(P)-dependent alcohol dehydrogenase [Streptomyces sp. NPDC057746]|uniref:zinc-dependent alcohol dehydrogenase family protein n=1 Tax=Streptomyces sp. NPDC057746 TaxID=3346237 RepID=UPI0036B0B030